MRLVKPKHFSHCPRKAYTLRGFDRTVMKNLMTRMGITQKEAEKLRRLYFPRGLTDHIDPTGAFRNKRRYQLYYLGRKLSKDRKQRLFDLVERSGMFYVYYDDNGRLAAFLSPWICARLGVIPVDQLLP